MPPHRVQLSRAKGWRMPSDTVKVDRTTRWGNPWQVRQDAGGQWWCGRADDSAQAVGSKDAGIGLAVKFHAAELAEQVRTHDGATFLLPLRGKNLACWCKLGTPCHADTLLALANAELSRE